jgi:hypothetical protein
VPVLLVCHSNPRSGLSTCLKSSNLKRGLLNGSTCGWSSAGFSLELLDIDMGCSVVGLHGPRRHRLVDEMVTSARTNTIIPPACARLPFPGSLAFGTNHGKLDADLRTFALLRTPFVQSVHGYYLFALEDGGRLAPMAVELFYRLAISLAVRRFLGMGEWAIRTLVFFLLPPSRQIFSCPLSVSVCFQHLSDRARPVRTLPQWFTVSRGRLYK